MKSFLLLILHFLLLSTVTAQQKEILYVGTYSVRDSKGIYVYEFNRSKGTAKLLQTISDAESPSFIEVHPTGKFLYAVNRGAIDTNQNSGSVSAYAIDPKTGKLSFINHVSSHGKEPCHISIDKTGEWAFISNYTEGNFIVLPILQDGSLGSVMESKKYSGSSINKSRQEQPHIHSSVIDKNNKYIYVSDLGTDKIYTYSIDVKNGKIIPAQKPEVQLTPGAGPRHFTLHPNGAYAYAAEELTSTVCTFSVDPTSGALTILQDTVRSLPPPFSEGNSSADIHTDPAGKFVYVSNRGHDALAIFSINPQGKIRLEGHQKTLGKTPRNFMIDPQGKFVLAANQNTDNITLFKINARTGMLSPYGKSIKTPSPVCLKLLRLNSR